MKSVVWIYTVNTDGVVIRSSGSGMMWISSKKFQDKLKKELLPEWNLSIISYDIAKNDIPDADIIMYNEMDMAYLDEKIKNTGLPGFTNHLTISPSAIPSPISGNLN